MSDTRNQLTDLAETLFSAPVTDFTSGWARIVESGFVDLLVPETSGGFNGDWGDAFAVLRIAGAAALPLPIGEAIVARYLADTAGITPEGDMLALADLATGKRDDDRFTGVLRRVPWGRHADAVLARIDGEVLVLNTADAILEEGVSIADEPHDTLHFEGATVRYAPSDHAGHSFGSFVRVAQAAGALDVALAKSIEHVNGRVQFGRPLSKQQSVQQALAIAASEAAAVNVAGQATALALDAGDAGFELVAAKLRTNLAIGICTRIFHQVHGAIGFTLEYDLQALTRRLMAWRSGYGSDRSLSATLGGIVASQGVAEFWPELTRKSDEAGRLAVSLQTT